MTHKEQSGSHIIALAVGLLALGVVAFAGYTVMQRNKTTPTSTASGTKLTTPSTITTKADLNATARSLDSASSDLDNSVDGSTLDSNLNDLL